MKRNVLAWLIVGDLITLFILTVVGFASHQELSTAGWRLMTTFLPLCVAWAFSAVPLGLYEPNIFNSSRQLWRALWAMALAGPLAALLRGIWLNRPILPLFALVLTAFGMLAVLIWRLIFWRLITRQSQDG